MWKNLYNSEDTIGSEGGEIIFDEEYRSACRITLERCKRYDAVTCGVYGAMCHTAFFDPAHSHEMYRAMKAELQSFIDRETTEEEEEEFYREFTEKY